jgi:hypothetical protein
MTASAAEMKGKVPAGLAGLVIWTGHPGAFAPRPGRIVNIARPKGAVSTASGPWASSPPPSAGSALASPTVYPIPGPAQTVSTGSAALVIVRECPPESIAVRQSPPSRRRCDLNHICGRPSEGCSTRQRQGSRPRPRRSQTSFRRSCGRSDAVMRHRSYAMRCRIRPFTYQGGALRAPRADASARPPALVAPASARRPYRKVAADH